MSTGCGIMGNGFDLAGSDGHVTHMVIRRNVFSGHVPTKQSCGATNVGAHPENTFSGLAHSAFPVTCHHKRHGGVTGLLWSEGRSTEG